MKGNFFASCSLAIFALFLTLLEIIIYFIKRKKSNILTHIYLGCVIASIITLLLEILSTYMIIYKGSSDITNIISKIFIGSQFFLFFMFTLYTGYLYLVKEENFDNKTNLKNVYIFLISSFVICIVIGILFPISYSCIGEFNTCAIGNPFMTVSRIAGTIGSSLHGTLILLSKKKIKGLNMGIIYFAVLAYIGFFAYYVINDFNTGFTTAFLALSTTVLFLTIENQDTKLLEGQKRLENVVIDNENGNKQFLLKLSHFYRSKYSTIMGLSSAKDLDNTYIEDLKNIEENNNDLLNLSTCVLDIINIENNNYISNYRNYSLSTLINDINKIKINNEMVIELKSNLNIDDIKCYGDCDAIYKIIYNIILSSNYHSICNKVYINLNIKNELIEYSISFFDGNMTNDVFNEKFTDFLESIDNSIEKYNMPLICAKTYAKMYDININYNRDEDKICTLNFSTPKIMIDKLNDLSRKEGETNAL